jgi:hypothetical protein
MESLGSGGSGGGYAAPQAAAAAASPSDPYDYLFKFLVIGSAGTGERIRFLMQNSV